MGFLSLPLQHEPTDGRRKSHAKRKKVFYTATENPSLTNLKLILKKRITTFNECSYLIDYISWKEGLAGKFDTARTLGILENHMGFSPKRPDSRKLTVLFDQGIKKLRDTGRLDTILSGYVLKD